jgi:hypothetical protein
MEGTKLENHEGLEAPSKPFRQTCVAAEKDDSMRLGWGRCRVWIDHQITRREKIGIEI